MKFTLIYAVLKKDGHECPPSKGYEKIAFNAMYFSSHAFNIFLNLKVAKSNIKKVRKYQ